MVIAVNTQSPTLQTQPNDDSTSRRSVGYTDSQRTVTLIKQLKSFINSAKSAVFKPKNWLRALAVFSQITPVQDAPARVNSDKGNNDKHLATNTHDIQENSFLRQQSLDSPSPTMNPPINRDINDISNLTSTDSTETPAEIQLNNISYDFINTINNSVIDTASKHGVDASKLFSEDLESTKYISLKTVFDVLGQTRKSFIATENHIPQILIILRDSQIEITFLYKDKENQNTDIRSTIDINIQINPKLSTFLNNIIPPYHEDYTEQQTIFGFDITVLSKVNDILEGKPDDGMILTDIQQRKVNEMVEELKTLEALEEQIKAINVKNTKLSYVNTQPGYGLNDWFLDKINTDAENDFNLYVSDADTLSALDIIKHANLESYITSQKPLTLHLTFSIDRKELQIHKATIDILDTKKTQDISQILQESSNSNGIKALQIIQAMDNEGANILIQGELSSSPIDIDESPLNTYKNLVKTLINRGILEQTEQPIKKDITSTLTTTTTMENSTPTPATTTKENLTSTTTVENIRQGYSRLIRSLMPNFKDEL